jgi:hypothetical protein
MKTFFFSLPRTDVSISLPDELERIILLSLSHFQRPVRISPLRCRYEIVRRLDYYELYKNRKLLGSFDGTLEVYGALEEDIENCLIKSCREWVAFHAGCVGAKGAACLIAGKPEAGKTSTTFILVETGKTFLCEEIAPVDPESRLVHPFPLALSLSRRFAREYGSFFSYKKGSLEDMGRKLSRYVPRRAAKAPLPLRMIILPSYNPSFRPDLLPLSPGEALPEILECCFCPNIDEEKFFDSVIRVITGCKIFRLRTNGIAATRNLARRLFSGLSLQA